jgi:ribokinase
VNYVIDIAKKHNIDVVLNPAPVPKDYANIHMDGVTYLSPNEIELEQILESVTKEELLKKIKYLILTKGADGSVAYSYNKEPIEVKAIKVTAVDTVGAGDCYNGALIVGISEGMELQQAMKFASMASSIAVGRKGAQTSIPSRAEVDASIDINKKGEKK